MRHRTWWLIGAAWLVLSLFTAPPTGTSTAYLAGFFFGRVVGIAVVLVGLQIVTGWLSQKVGRGD